MFHYRFGLFLLPHDVHLGPLVSLVTNRDAGTSLVTPHASVFPMLPEPAGFCPTDDYSLPFQHSEPPQNLSHKPAKSNMSNKLEHLRESPC
jgi:hypothetical protein